MFILDGPDWGIRRPETKINPPVFSAQQAIDMVKRAAERRQALSFNLLMYEDGAVSLQSLEVLRAVRKAVRVPFALSRWIPVAHFNRAST